MKCLLHVNICKLPAFFLRCSKTSKGYVISSSCGSTRDVGTEHSHDIAGQDHIARNTSSSQTLAVGIFSFHTTPNLESFFLHIDPPRFLPSKLYTDSKPCILDLKILVRMTWLYIYFKKMVKILCLFNNLSMQRSAKETKIALVLPN